MRGWQLVAIAMIATPLCWAQNEPAHWAVDPAQPGPDSPPAGRSLFDFVATVEAGGRRVYDVPFPFERLVRRLEQRAGCAAGGRCAQQVLIPLGRSLQRLAAAPEFFKYPRVVAAIDNEPAREGAPLLQDRIYLGYQEQAALIEVISYNEAAGRFEFQIVRDYRPGGTPQVVYARRAVCTACHQNLAPLFSQPLWEETNANERVAARLERERPAFYGVRVRRGIDVPDAIDAATGRANWIGVWQRLWSEGCGVDGAAAARCRAAAFTAALKYRLTGERAFDDRGQSWREALQASLLREWRARWPGGLAIPNPDIPNRDPLPYAPGREPAGAGLAHVPAAFEPLQPRPPLETWTGERPDTVRRFVGGLAGFLTAADSRALDAHLARLAAGAERRTYEAPCELAWTRRWLRFKCASAADAAPQRLVLEGRLDLGGTSVTGELNTLAVGDGTSLEQFEIGGAAVDLKAGSLAFMPASRGVRARLAGGSAVERIELRWRAADARILDGIRAVAGRASVHTVDDFAPVHDAVAGMVDEGVFGARPFSRAAMLSRLFAKLGRASPEWCCDDASRMPPAVVEPKAPAAFEGTARAYAAFYAHCAICHATSERFPPNFLAGTGERVAANIRQCAPRIYVRLAMWRIAPGARDKTPMPPQFPSTDAIAYSPPAPVAALEGAIVELLRAEYGAALPLEQLLAAGYEALRPCLPANDQPQGRASR